MNDEIVRAKSAMANLLLVRGYSSFETLQMNEWVAMGNSEAAEKVPSPLRWVLTSRTIFI